MRGQRRARLILEDGSTFDGWSFGADVSCAGEVVFSTGIAGYPESLTDPSYRGQILALTYPLIGNYGVPDRSQTNGLLDHFESERMQVSGLVISTLSRSPSHWSAVMTLDDWMRAEGVPGIEGVDTRALTQRLRSRGVMAGRLIPEGCAEEIEPACAADRLVADVSIREPVLMPSPRSRGVTVGVLDCGVKYNILRLLLERGADVLRIPWDVDPLGLTPRLDGLLISNGPGDPKDVGRSVEVTRRVMKSGMPAFGICFGNQILALAAGADTYKLPFGHRGQNQPCIDLETGRCYITSQNHGYAVDERTLPDDWQPWFRNANDGTNEGIRHTTKPWRAIQFHPEAHPGPEDLHGLIDDFIAGLGSDQGS